jgi:hypothetical protein
MRLQAIALAITCFIRSALEILAEEFIRLVHQEFALVDRHAEQATGDSLPARAGLIRQRPQRMAE